MVSKLHSSLNIYIYFKLAKKQVTEYFKYAQNQSIDSCAKRGSKISESPFLCKNQIETFGSYEVGALSFGKCRFLCKKRIEKSECQILCKNQIQNFEPRSIVIGSKPRPLIGRCNLPIRGLILPVKCVYKAQPNHIILSISSSRNFISV